MYLRDTLGAVGIDLVGWRWRELNSVLTARSSNT